MDKQHKTTSVLNCSIMLAVQFQESSWNVINGNRGNVNYSIGDTTILRDDVVRFHFCFLLKIWMVLTQLQ